MSRRWLAGLAVAVASVVAHGSAWAVPHDWGIDFQPAATPIMDRVESFHGLLVWVCVLISLFVLGLLAVTCFRFRESVSPEPSRRSHNTLLEVVWTAVPVLILVIVAVPSFKLLYFEDVLPQTDMTIKATGHQWYWSYTYPDSGPFEFVSNMVADGDLQPGQLRLLQTDNEVVVPVATKVRIQVTGGDVLHSWAMPQFGLKLDAVPGRLNEGWFEVAEPGVFYGQCSELCGVNHAFMPITIRALSKDDYAAWLEKAKAEFATDDGAASTRVAAAAPVAR